MTDRFDEKARRFHRYHMGGMHADDCEDMCSDKLSQALRTVAAESFEEAAKIAEERADGWGMRGPSFSISAQDAANRIRAKAREVLSDKSSNENRGRE